MDLESKIKELQVKKQQLLARQADIVNELKTKRPDAHAWLVEHKIDLQNLKKYATKITVAAAMATITFSSIPTLIDNPGDYAQEQTKTIEVNELQGLDEEAKANLVWERYGPIINIVAKKHDIDPQLIFATIMLESGGDTYAIRHEPQINDASYGLGQVLYGTARLIGFQGSAQDLHTPEISINLIGQYHRRNMDVYGQGLTPEQLTVAYNAGSPYSSPHPGHLTKFQKWFRIAGESMS